MDICVHLPDSDPTVGLFGTLNGNAKDEWTTFTGEVIPKESGKNRKKEYDVCTKHFCNRKKEDSLFVYEEEGIDFDHYEMCDLPYGATSEKFLTQAPQWVLDLCKGDVACVMDVQNGDAEDAIALRNANLNFKEVCSPSGGECDTSDCCGDLKCVDMGGLAGKVCDGDMTVSAIAGQFPQKRFPVI